MQFIESPNKYVGRNSRLRLVVWHDMEAPEATTTAENIAHYFAKPTTRASAHICVDQDSVVECVKPDDTAWAAPGANSDGYQIELAGYARQSREEWLDAASQATIANAARAVAPVMRAHNIPARWLTDAQLRDGKSKGMVTHAQVSRVFRKSDHTDPGSHFPEDFCLAQVQAAIDGKVAPLPAPAPAGPRTVLRRGDQGDDVAALQRGLASLGYDVGAVDGDFGPRTEAAVKALQQAAQIAVDGIAGPQTHAALVAGVRAPTSTPAAPTPKPPAPAPDKPEQLVVDGDLGPKTISRWQQVMGTPVDGVISKPSVLIAKVQKWLAGFGIYVTRDGVLGPQTVRGIQKYLGVRQDGALGPVTVRAIQTRLNTGRF